MLQARKNAVEQLRLAEEELKVAPDGESELAAEDDACVESASRVEEIGAAEKSEAIRCALGVLAAELWRGWFIAEVQCEVRLSDGGGRVCAGWHA
jgi:hypothetical protein